MSRAQRRAEHELAWLAVENERAAAQWQEKLTAEQSARLTASELAQDKLDAVDAALDDLSCHWNAHNQSVLNDLYDAAFQNGVAHANSHPS